MLVEKVASVSRDSENLEESSLTLMLEVMSSFFGLSVLALWLFLRKEKKTISNNGLKQQINSIISPYWDPKKKDILIVTRRAADRLIY